jgi:hypothetical protein
MEFIERYDVTKCQYLASLNLKQMKPFIGQTAKNDDERRILLNKIQRFCKGIIEARGQMIRQYRYSLSTPLESGGRLFSGLSIQGLPKKIRGFLVRDSTVDIDMVNAHPTILRYICKKHHIHAAELSNYVSNRDEVLSQFDDRDKAKTQFLVAVNSDKEIRTTSSVLRKFDKEMKSIQTQLSQMTDYRNITNSVPDERGNFNGSAINRILCMYENKILQVVLIPDQATVGSLETLSNHYHLFYDDAIAQPAIQLYIHFYFLNRCFPTYMYEIYNTTLH